MAAVLACPGKVISIKMMKAHQQEGENDLAYFSTAITHPANGVQHGHCMFHQSEMSQHLPRGLEEQVLSMHVSSREK